MLFRGESEGERGREGERDAVYFECDHGLVDNDIINTNMTTLLNVGRACVINIISWDKNRKSALIC